MDPQRLGFFGSAKALLALGRIPFALEVASWTLLGCILSSEIFPSNTSSSSGLFLSNLNLWATLQCLIVTWGTNVAINYGNDYFDWDLDRAEQVESIKKDMEKRNPSKKSTSTSNGHSSTSQGVNTKTKMAGNTTRIIHDGTFPPWVALLLSFVWEAGLVGLIAFSRSKSASSSLMGKAEGTHTYTPFTGLALQIGIFCTIISHSYAGPPLRLHYNGYGELVSALFLAPIALVFGMVGHYTAVTGRAVSFTDLFVGQESTSGFTLDAQLWLFVIGIYLFEQARILVMHTHDMETDVRGGKNTFVSKIGHRNARNLYAILSALSMLCFARFGYNLQHGKGMLFRSGGTALSGGSAARFASVWTALMVIVMAYAIPIALMVLQACDDDIPGPKKTAKKNRILPTIDMHSAAIIVSLETLVTPLLLSVGAIVAERYAM